MQCTGEETPRFCKKFCILPCRETQTVLQLPFSQLVSVQACVKQSKAAVPRSSVFTQVLLVLVRSSVAEPKYCGMATGEGDGD